MKNIYQLSISGILLLFVACLNACVEPIANQEVSSAPVLVVDGFLSNERKAHLVSLTRVQAINQTEVIPEEGARVWLQDENGEIIPLSEQASGKYVTDSSFQGVIGRQYQLFIETQNQASYHSLPVLLKSCPPVDTVYATYQTGQIDLNDGIQIFVDTQDPRNQTRFYRWQWEGTYEIRTPFPSRWIWLGENKVEFRREEVGICWADIQSNTILVESTIGLAEDKVVGFPIQLIPDTSQVIRTRYSILVKQMALDNEAFFFWKTLRDINENQGSLFDVQPGSVFGNIISDSDPEETILGYFDASEVSTYRTFFSPRDFRDQGFNAPPFFIGCARRIDTVGQFRIGEYMETNDNQNRKEIWEVFGLTPFAQFQVLPRLCSNCTDFGTNVEPDFW